MSLKKAKRTWVYVSEEDQPRLQALVKAVGSLNETMILGAIASARLKACEEIGYRLPLPLKFEVKETVPEITRPEARMRR